MNSLGGLARGSSRPRPVIGLLVIVTLTMAPEMAIVAGARPGACQMFPGESGLGTLCEAIRAAHPGAK
jgi:hypothetical protein